MRTSRKNEDPGPGEEFFFQSAVIPNPGADLGSRRLMRRPLKFRTRRGGRFILAAGLLISLSWGGNSASAGHQTAGKPVPDLELPTLQGKSISLKSLRGKVVFLNFWATWCLPCRHEMPAMERLYGRLKEKGFEILAVSIDARGEEVVAPFVKKLGLTYPILLDRDMDALRAFGVRGMPTTFLIDREGRIAHLAVGPREWDGKDALKLIRGIMNRGKAL